MSFFKILRYLSSSSPLASFSCFLDPESQLSISPFMQGILPYTKVQTIFFLDKFGSSNHYAA